MLLADLGERGGKLAPQLPVVELLLGRGSGIVDGTLLVILGRQRCGLRLRLPVARMIDADVHGDAEQPGRKAAVAAEILDRTPRTQKNLLRDVGGVLGIAGGAQRNDINALFVAAHELLEGVQLAATRPCQNMLVVQPVLPPFGCHSSETVCLSSSTIS